MTSSADPTPAAKHSLSNSHDTPVQNPVGLCGLEFIEFSSPEPQNLERLFKDFGFAPTMVHGSLAIDRYTQGQINILLNRSGGSFAHGFHQLHGPSIPSMGWRVQNAEQAFKIAVSRGAKPAQKKDYAYDDGEIPAIYGIGDSLIYFVDRWNRPAPYNLYEKMGFVKNPNVPVVEPKGFTVIDHLTNNVPQGTMAQWSEFYKKIFGFVDIRYFDIRGVKTGLTSYALKSPCGTFCIPINEGTEKKSQINEYLEEYKGAGIQHLAFATEDIVSTLKRLQSTQIETLSIDDDYYAEVFQRVPNVTEDHRTLRDLQILVDGDEEGYLLQIFTKNVVGPIFIEIIQRKNHFAFGEGNFGALFRSLERDQERRGVL